MKETESAEPTRETLLQPFMKNHERSAHWAQHPRHKVFEAGAADPYRRIGIVGGGTAGFLAALALREKFPHLEVTLIESSDIPIIGVGEATTPHIVPFLHKFCGINVHEFYQKVRPTWKMGIRFEWGPPEISHFNAPFDWEINDVGALGSLQYDGNINSMTLGSVFMEQKATPVLMRGGRCTSLLPDVSFAYHLENRRLVKYLHEVANAKGVKHLDRKITDVVVTADGQEIDHLVTNQGEKLSFDLYIDCTGFRSLLLEKALKSPFISFGSTLFTDRALTFNSPHDGIIKPYTTATTMNSGWTWTIPHEERDNQGYVFCSAFCTPEEAEREVRARWPRMNEVSDVVHFRSGRHEDCWKGNVVAIGNAHGFVEPLESTGLFMICVTIQKLLALFPQSKSDTSSKTLFNSFVATRWDGLRWFLGIHFKFNRKLDTPYWKEVRAKADISGGEYLVRAFQERGPLLHRPNEVLQLIKDSSNLSIFFGVEGWDCILLGNGVHSNLYDVSEPRETWQRRKQAALDITSQSVSHARALELCREHPELLDEVNGPRAWPRRDFPGAAM
ncbi:MAG TPA: tryptophan 7-halogenase [Polyangium sp.]|nr:tryptophan 7-halogenase [Polyangium sp.]